jgi:hypothetical protein
VCSLMWLSGECRKHFERCLEAGCVQRLARSFERNDLRPNETKHLRVTRIAQVPIEVTIVNAYHRIMNQGAHSTRMYHPPTHVLYGTTIENGCSPTGVIDSNHLASAFSFSAFVLRAVQNRTERSSNLRLKTGLKIRKCHASGHARMLSRTTRKMRYLASVGAVRSRVESHGAVSF